jgi:dihydrofolate synthase / folylpolyglutamate synthase
MKTFAEAYEILSQFWPVNLQRKGYTLEYMVQFMDFLDNPQDKLKVIHVAGTSGKGSTAYYAAALLKAGGKKAGLSVGPHVDQLSERVQINLVPMPEAEFCKELTVFLELVKKSKIPITYFELLIAFAFWQYARQGLEYVVMEVGLGGLTDATNVVTRPDKVCVITDIGLDHINVLGSSLGEISAHKAGIIQLHNSVFCYRQAKEVMEPIEARAKQKQADLYVLDAAAAQTGFDALPLFQQRNLGLAHAAVNHLLKTNGQPALTKAMLAEAAKTYIPARMETLKLGAKTLILDGAHNAQKLHALSESLQKQYDGPVAAIVSLLDGRSYRLEDATKELAGFLDHIIITTYGGDPKDGPHRSVEAEVLEEHLRKHGARSLEVLPEPKAALEALLQRPEPVLLVTGSLFLLNHIRPLLPVKH